MTIVVIGKTGLLGQTLQVHEGWQCLSHEEALQDTGWVTTASCVINCAFSPVLRTGPYQAEQDIDLKLAMLIKNSTNCHYIMISTRAVYGLSDGLHGWAEDATPSPLTDYARNKLQIENNVRDILSPERQTILRLTTMFGYELDRPSFFGLALTGLLRHETITLDMDPLVKRDFLSVWRFADAMKVIAANPEAGIYNLGSGIGTECGAIAGWLIEGFGDGHLNPGTAPKDPFWLDMTKTYTTWPALHVITADDTRNDVLQCGEWLASQRHYTVG